MRNENHDAKSVAEQVGYERRSQFSREHSRLFGPLAQRESAECDSPRQPRVRPADTGWGLRSAT